MAAPNRPQFFCTRPDGSLVPLVSVDDLPPGLNIQGLPRVLSVGETQGMTSCGMANPRSEPWSVEGVAHVFPHELGMEGLVEIQKLLVQMVNDPQVPPHIRGSVKNILYRGISHPAGSVLPVEASSNGTAMSPLAPAFVMNNQIAKGVRLNWQCLVCLTDPLVQSFNSKKEYCSYWIRHGECDYAQQGCLYKHEMPTEPELLEKLGLRDIPRWYREKHNVGSVLYQGQGNRQQLSLPEQPQMRAIGNSTREISGSPEGKASTANSKLNKTPPRGPANHGHGGFNNSNNRGGNRNGGSNGQYGAPHSWKGGRNGRSRAVTSPKAKSSASELSNERSPAAASASTMQGRFDFGQFGALLPAGTAMTSAPSAVQVTNASPVTPVTPVTPVIPLVPNVSLLDDGNARNRYLAFKVNELTRIDEDIFDKYPKPFEPPGRRSDARQMHAHTSNPSTDGGVMLPKEVTQTYATNFGEGNKSVEAPRQYFGNLNAPSTTMATCGSSPASLSDLVAPENIALGAMDTRVTWGPIGGPIMKSSSPPTDPRLAHYGQYPVKPNNNSSL